MLPILLLQFIKRCWFEAAEPRFGLEKAALRDGELWSCPHCRRPVTVRGVLGKGLPLDATVVLGSVTVQG